MLAILKDKELRKEEAYEDDFIFIRLLFSYLVTKVSVYGSMPTKAAEDLRSICVNPPAQCLRIRARNIRQCHLEILACRAHRDFPIGQI